MDLFKPLKVILIERFVLIKQDLNFNRKRDEMLFQYKIISNLGCCGQTIAFTLPVTVKTICLLKSYQSYSNSREIYRKGGQGLFCTRISS